MEEGENPAGIPAQICHPDFARHFQRRKIMMKYDDDDDEEDYYCMTKGSKNPLAAMFETSVMCRPDSLVKNIMISIIGTIIGTCLLVDQITLLKIS